MNKSQIGLAGEFYALAQLTHRGYITSLTLGNTKGVDILVANEKGDSHFKVEVKTTTKKPHRKKLYSELPVYSWSMSKKHEGIKSKDLVYCFVALNSGFQSPEFFLVPSKKVATYLQWEHQHWLETRTKKVKSTDMRNFRVVADGSSPYRDNWSILG